MSALIARFRDNKEHVLIAKIVKAIFPEGCLIAGGYARDAFFDKKPKDVDVIMQWPVDKVPLTNGIDIGNETMSRLADYMEDFCGDIQGLTSLEIDGYRMSFLFDRVCPNYGGAVDGSGEFNDLIACVLKLKAHAWSVTCPEHLQWDVDIIVPRSLEPVAAYIANFDYNINQFVMELSADESSVVITHCPTTDKPVTTCVQEVGNYGSLRRIEHLIFKYPELDWEQCGWEKHMDIAHLHYLLSIASSFVTKKD